MVAADVCSKADALSLDGKRMHICGEFRSHGIGSCSSRSHRRGPDPRSGRDFHRCQTSTGATAGKMMQATGLEDGACQAKETFKRKHRKEREGSGSVPACGNTGPFEATMSSAARSTLVLLSTWIDSYVWTHCAPSWLSGPSRCPWCCSRCCSRRADLWWTRTRREAAPMRNPAMQMQEEDRMNQDQ